LTGTLQRSAARFLGRLAALARSNARLLLRVATSEMPGADRRAIGQPGMRDAFLDSYTEVFRHGSQGERSALEKLPGGHRREDAG